MYVLNTTINEYLIRIKLGQIALPHYQRLWAWSRPMVCEFFRAILLNRPVGAILTYDIPQNDPLEPRPIDNAPQLTTVSRYLLDGQQRLTSLYLGLTNTFERDKCRYYVDLSEDELTVNYVTNPTQWLDNPLTCVERRCFPLPLFSPDAETRRIQFFTELAQHAGEQFLEPDRIKLQQEIGDLTAQLRNHQIPELVLESTVQPDIALDVFVKMNTNNSDLDSEDIAVAMAALRNVNLRKYFSKIEETIPTITKIADLPWVVLSTAALLNNLKPSSPVFRSRKIADYISNKINQEIITRAISASISILRTVKVYSARMLPTKIVIPLIATIWTQVTRDRNLTTQETAIVESFLHRIFWFATLSDRYDRQSNSRVQVDTARILENIDAVITQNWDRIEAPLFNSNMPSISNISEAAFPTRSSRLGKAVFLVSLQDGAPDPLSGVNFDVNIDQIGLPDYHHFFPKGWAERVHIDSQIYNTAMNCVFLQPLANREIQRRDPRDYIMNCNGNPPGWACALLDDKGNHIIDENNIKTLKNRLSRQLIPWDQAIVKITGDNEEELHRNSLKAIQFFINCRAELVYDRIRELTT